MIFHGQKFEEVLFETSYMPEIEVDLAVFVMGWESRSQAFIQTGAIRGRKCLVFSFADDGICQESREQFYERAAKCFNTVVPVKLPEALNRIGWQSEVEKIFKTPANTVGNTCFVDYTSLPKAVTQTLYRFLLVDQSFCQSHWGYLEGSYPSEPLGSRFSQGLAEPFFPIRHTPGTGGTSEKQALIVSIGADEQIIFDLLETRSYDAVAVLHSNSQNSPALEQSRRSTLGRLHREYGVANEFVLESSASSVNDAIENYIALIRKIPREYSVDIFCCGTKSHSVAACAVAQRFKETVSLLGRIPKNYNRHDVVASGRGSISTMTDYTNPMIAALLAK
ncbi:hypothetical protein [Citreimonas salinaria]|uniref:Uncharacterized protein n=1 Tax=Citreimonas salinaria TaxID=321339 RepID=A0A1H3LNN3_9RHOB|nr:hypothetical protein [Citreimonas salinaria]SDY65588.1 hypothetical protein SAMN05444340_113102 [Citreimonas salinaria]